MLQGLTFQQQADLLVQLHTNNGFIAAPAKDSILWQTHKAFYKEHTVVSFIFNLLLIFSDLNSTIEQTTVIMKLG